MRATTSKSEVKIVLQDEDKSVYYTHDLIEGYIRLHFDDDTLLEDISTTLEGQVMVCVNNISNLLHNGGNVFGKHSFLRMAQPIRATTLPEDSIAVGGKEYELPFSFTVPEKLLPYACSHGKYHDDLLRQEHLCLPPSLGTFETEDFFMQDLGPSTAKVAYKIFARIGATDKRGTKTNIERSVGVRIIPTANPALDESIDVSSPHLRLAQVRKVYKLSSVPGTVAGHLTLESMPVVMRLQHPHSIKKSSAPANLILGLRFESDCEGQGQPQLISMKLKLRSFTFQGTIPYKTLQELCNGVESNAKCTHYTTTVQLRNQKLDTVRWSKDENLADGSTASLPDYGTVSEVANESKETPKAELNRPSLPAYTACVRAYVGLPHHVSKQCKKMLLIPSFNSCIVARAYVLELDLSCKAQYPDSGSTKRALQRFVPPSNFKLNIPLQINIESESNPNLLGTALQPPIPYQDADADNLGRNSDVEELYGDGNMPVLEALDEARDFRLPRDADSPDVEDLPSYAARL